MAGQVANLKAGGPDTLTITSTAGDSIKLNNVLVGEVWLASGQSNMEFPLKSSHESAADIAASANPMIHLLHVPKARLDSPTNDIGASWTECNPETRAGLFRSGILFRARFAKGAACAGWRH